MLGGLCRYGHGTNEEDELLYHVDDYPGADIDDDDLYKTAFDYP